MFKNDITLSTYIYIMYLVLYKLKPVNLWFPVKIPMWHTFPFPFPC